MGGLPARFVATSQCVLRAQVDNFPLKSIGKESVTVGCTVAEMSTSAVKLQTRWSGANLEHLRIMAAHYKLSLDRFLNRTIERRWVEHRQATTQHPYQRVTMDSAKLKAARRLARLRYQKKYRQANREEVNIGQRRRYHARKGRSVESVDAYALPAEARQVLAAQESHRP